MEKLDGEKLIPKRWKKFVSERFSGCKLERAQKQSLKLLVSPLPAFITGWPGIVLADGILV
jgi:hypothetical protein